MIKKYLFTVVSFFALAITLLYTDNLAAATQNLVPVSSQEVKTLRPSNVAAGVSVKTFPPSLSFFEFPASTKNMASIAGNTLNITQAGIYAPIVEVGLSEKGAVDVPSEAYVGRWNGSSLPGAKGAVFFDGHSPGVFSGLSKLRDGQTFEVRYNEQSFVYKIVHKETVDREKVDMSRALSPYENYSEGLNMMTCAGNYDPSIETYDKRLIVYSVRI